MEEIDATQLRKKLGQYFRSTMVHITNGTDVPLHLKTRRIPIGSWFRGCSPPTTIDPHTEVIFASTSRSKWVGGTEAEVAYDTRGEGTGPPSEFRLRWVNGISVGDRGRYCEAEVAKITLKSRGPGSIGLALSTSNSDNTGAAGGDPGDTYYVAKDDDDQEENSEVYFTITSLQAAEEHASQFGEGSYIQPRKGTSISAQETVFAGFLNKRRPDGLGFFWQLRYFMLTRQKLSYFRAVTDTRAHAQLGQLALKDVIAVQLDEGSTELVVVIANSQRAPYTLKAERPDLAKQWVEAIEMHAPRILMMKGQGGASAAGGSSGQSQSGRAGGSSGSNVSGSTAGDILQPDEPEPQPEALRYRGSARLDGIAEGSESERLSISMSDKGRRDDDDHGDSNDDDEGLLPTSRTRTRTGAVRSPTAGDDHDVPPDPDDYMHAVGNGNGRGAAEEGGNGDGALWDGLPGRRQVDDEGGDDAGSAVSTRLMFASDDGRRP